jgi:hypothetical protein
MKTLRPILGLMILGAVGAFFAAACGPTSGAPGRRINFPNNRSLGKVFIRDFGSTDELKWQNIGEAQGTVEIPPGKEVGLAVEGHPDLSFLRSLGKADLQLLDFTYAKGIKDADLANLRDLTMLNALWLTYQSEITDEGLAHLQAMTGLKRLKLNFCQKITDRGLAYLGGHTQLVALDLQFTQVSDAGLEQLKNLQNLRYIFLAETQVTPSGIENLRKMLPNCIIQMSPPPDR